VYSLTVTLWTILEEGGMYLGDWLLRWMAFAPGNTGTAAFCHDKSSTPPKHYSRIPTVAASHLFRISQRSFVDSHRTLTEIFSSPSFACFRVFCGVRNNPATIRQEQLGNPNHE
jgi:hypothetical protein